MSQFLPRVLAVVALTAAAAGAQAPAAGPGQEPTFTPAFKGQTNAPPPDRPSQFTVEVIAKGLAHPWSMQFLPDGRMLVTERPGRIRIVDRQGGLGDPIAGVPAVRVVAGEGLHDVALDPQFAKNRLIYISYFAPPAGQPGGAIAGPEWQQWLMRAPNERMKDPIGVDRVARGRLSNDEKTLEDVKPIIDGGDRRLVFAKDGTLFVLADTPAGGGPVPIDDLPQRLDNLHGKVLRIHTDGSAPKDNPFLKRAGAKPEIYAIGLRDPEGGAINPATGQLWTVEHGVKGGDELNIVRSGANLGFPLISYGVKYSGEPIGEGATAKPGLEQPIYYWNPDIGPSGMLFYTGNLFPAWKGSLFVGALPAKHLVRLVLNKDRVIAEERLLVDLAQRVRDVRQGPDQAVYVLTDEDDGRILRLAPKR